MRISRNISKKIIFLKRISLQKGFSLVEILLAVGTFSLIVMGLSGAFIYGEESTVLSGERAKASLLAEEGLEALRNIRDENFSGLAEGNHGFDNSSGQWTFSGSQDATDSLFTRQVIISTVDANTKLATVNVSWQQNLQRPGLVSVSSYLTNWQAPNVPPHGGMLAYADFSGNDDVIRYKLFDDSGNCGSQQTVPDFGVPLDRPTRVLRLYSSPTRNEKILVTKHFLNSTGNDQYIFAQVWNGSSWGNVVQLGTGWAGTTRPEVRDFDGDYLNNGNFLLVYDDDTNIPKYRIWDGSNWSNQASAPTVGGNPEWIIVKNRPGTNQAMMAVLDAGLDTNTSLWNGSSWSAVTEHATGSVALSPEILSFNWSPNDNTRGALIFNEASDNFPNIRIWNGTTWSSNVENINIGGLASNMQIVGRSGANDFLACIKDGSDDINCLESNFTPLWSTLTNGELEDTTDSGTQTSFDLGYEKQSGDLALSVYSDSTALPKYRTFNPSINTWSIESSLSTITGTLETVRIVPDPLSDDMMVLMGASDQDVHSVVWDGANNQFYSSGDRAKREHGVSGSNDVDFWFDFAWDKN